MCRRGSYQVAQSVQTLSEKLAAGLVGTDLVLDRSFLCNVLKVLLKWITSC